MLLSQKQAEELVERMFGSCARQEFKYTWKDRWLLYPIILERKGDEWELTK